MISSRMSYGAKVISAGVLLKAVLMGTLVSVLAVTSFGESVALVLVSATATGVFGLLIVLVQAHADSRLHDRIDKLESAAGRIESQASEAATTAAKAANVGEQTQATVAEIAQTVSNGGETNA